MIALIMFLFLAGGQNKNAKARCTFTNVSASGSVHSNCDPSADDPTSKGTQRKYFNGMNPRKSLTPGISHKVSAVLLKYSEVEGYPSEADTSGSITVKDGSKVVMLSDNEYAHLQDLRKAVADEEKRLAVKYGADIGRDYCAGDMSAMVSTGCFGAHYEYHGQFLLIEKGK